MNGCAYCGAELTCADSIYCRPACQRAGRAGAANAVFGMGALIVAHAVTPCCGTFVDLVANAYVHHGYARPDEPRTCTWTIVCPACETAHVVTVATVSVTRDSPTPGRLETARAFVGAPVWNPPQNSSAG